MVNLLKRWNKCFKPVVHPFNLNNDGIKTYSMWQYEKGEDTIKFYLDYLSKDEMFRDKEILDIGCGAGGKSLYYASCGAKKVTGVDIVPKYEQDSMELAKKLNLQNKFQFIIADASKLPFPSHSFDTIIMNDAMEHVAQPEAVLREVMRVLKKGGKVFINFPPYNHPFGAHLSDVIFIPWVHLFFSDKTLIKAYKELVKDLPDGEERISFRISKDQKGREYFSYINKMTLKRYKKILNKLQLTPVYYKEVPLRGFLKPVAKLPFFREYFVKMAVSVIEK